MKNYTIQKGKNKYSPFAGIKLISGLIEKLNFKDEINSGFSLPGSNRGYTPSAYIKSIILGLLLGADCIMDIDNIKQDEVLKDITDIEIPHSTRIGSFLYSASKVTSLMSAFFIALTAVSCIIRGTESIFNLSAE